MVGFPRGEAGGWAAGIFIGVVIVIFPVKGFYIGMALAPLVHHIRRPFGPMVYVVLGTLIASGQLIDIWRWPTPSDLRAYGPPMAGVLIYGATLLATRRRQPRPATVLAPVA